MSSGNKNGHSARDDGNRRKTTSEKVSSETVNQSDLLNVEDLPSCIQNIANRTEIEASPPSSNSSRKIQLSSVNEDLEGDKASLFSNNTTKIGSQSILLLENKAANDCQSIVHDINNTIDKICGKPLPSSSAKFTLKASLVMDEEKPIIDVSNPFLINPTSSFSASQSKYSITTLESDKGIEEKSLLVDETEENDLAPQTLENIGNNICIIGEISQDHPSVDEESFVRSTGEVMETLLTTENGKISTVESEFIQPTASTLEREILLRGEINDKRANILQLPSETIPSSPSHCEKEIVGDDAAKTAIDILCECGQASVTGGAVPVVTSFNTANDKSQNNVANFMPEMQSKRELGRSKARPSLIPKLSSNFRKEKLHSSSRTEKKTPSQNEAEKPKQLRNICFSSPEERVKQATSLEGANKTEVAITNKSDPDLHEKQCLLNWEHEPDKKQTHYKKLSSEFSKYVSRLAEEASNLPGIKDPDVQMTAVDDLYKRITILKKIANEMKALNTSAGPQFVNLDKAQTLGEVSNCPESSNSKTKAKNKENNRIHIKFLPTKTTVKKKVLYNSLPTEPDAIILKSPEPEMPKKPIQIDAIEAKEVDSMDGMFIPSFDEPPKIDDDDDEDGLDITITFPELQRAFNQADSHLSVSFSSISAEALGHLKRCPKEFTLRMDFIQGRMFFQSGKSPANNYAIGDCMNGRKRRAKVKQLFPGPDLKITECNLGNKQSDIINIKPFTECLYASQIIPVEGATRKDSLKILKSTDSELFKVVGLPYVPKRTSAATKSCITFKNVRPVSSESALAERTLCKSMPQIPSLIRILEEPDLESVVSGIRTGNPIVSYYMSNENIVSKTRPKLLGVTSSHLAQFISHYGAISMVSMVNFI